MKNALVGLLFLTGLGVLAPAPADESVPPAQVGIDETTSLFANGQILRISASGVGATVYFDQLNSSRVTGQVVRTSGGSSSGTVSILWVNKGEQIQLFLGPANPNVPFGMEGGEGDKRLPQP